MEQPSAVRESGGDGDSSAAGESGRRAEIGSGNDTANCRTLRSEGDEFKPRSVHEVDEPCPALAGEGVAPSRSEGTFGEIPVQEVGYSDGGSDQADKSAHNSACLNP